MISFPSIGQFKQVIKAMHEHHSYAGKDSDGSPIYKSNPEPLPVVEYTGMVKLHGSNSSIGQRPDGSVFYQSRNRTLNPPDNDNMGFATFCLEQGREFWEMVFTHCRREFGIDGTIILFGEWCCGNAQKGVALTQVPDKRFIIFSVAEAVNGEITHWVGPDEFTGLQIHHDRIKFITEFPDSQFKMTIDFNNPQLVQNELIKLTEQVEQECPVGKALGVSGTGEGIVWRPSHPDYQDSKWWFKVKGELHSVSKVKTLCEVDLDKLKDISELINTIATENRFKQGVDYLREMQLPITQASTSSFLKWIVADIHKEEQDLITSSGLPEKELNKQISTRARAWYFNNLE